MSELARWLAREARRQAARPDLLGALVSGRRLAYARHRLGFLALRMLLRAGLHALEIGLLTAAFVPFEFIAPLIAYRALCALAGAAHWGALEVMRERVREAVRRRRLEAARLPVERWLGLTLWAAGAALALTLALEVGSALTTARIELRDAFAFACVLRLGMDSAMRVLHSGVFALRRVYRPLWSTVAPELVEFAILVAGFAELGVWAIPLGIVAGGICDAALGSIAVRRAYRQRRLQLPRLARSLAAARLPAAELRAAAPQALANVGLQLDGLVLLLLVQAGGTGAFATLYYVLRPLMAASTQGLRAFYFDLKLIESAGLRAFRPQLVRYLERLAVSWALLLAALTLVLARAMFGPDYASLPLLLLIPFFVARSAFALVQLLAFGAGELGLLFRSSLVVLAGLGCFRLLELRDLALVTAITLLLAGVAALAQRAKRNATRAPVEADVFDLSEWLAWVGAHAKVQLAVLCVNHRAGTTGGLVRALRAAFPGGAIARWGRRHALLALPEGSAVSARDLVVASGGVLSRAWISVAAPPAVAFEQARREAALPDGWQETRDASRSAGGLPELIATFRETFANGELLDLHSGRSLSARPVTAAILHEFVSSIRARSRGRQSRSERGLPFEVAVFAPCGQARAIFIADKQAPGFDAFRARVRLATLQASWPHAFALVESGTSADAAQIEAASLR